IVDDAEETAGINDRVALTTSAEVLKKRINEEHLWNGVTIVDPNQTYIGPDVVIEQDVTIYPGTSIFGKTIIKSGTEIGPNSKIGSEANIGPYAHIRPDTLLGSQVKVGNFVEVKNSTVGDHTKLAHLNYVGDAELGENINLGCGAITVNYDGVEKHKTIIED